VLLAPDHAGADHLKALARISRLLRENDTIAKLRGTDTAEGLYSILTEPSAAASAAGRRAMNKKLLLHWGGWGIMVLTVLGIGVTLLPYFWMVSSSLKTGAEVFEPNWWIPQEISGRRCRLGDRSAPISSTAASSPSS
jgi:hypothetical protein